MKRIIKLFVFVFALVGIIIAFNIVSYAFDECNDVDLNVGKILNHNTHINITGDTIIEYYNHINDASKSITERMFSLFQLSKELGEKKKEPLEIE